MNATAAGTAVDIESVSVAYGANVVLRDISVGVAPGEFFALLGPSGSGKSTLLRLIAGFVEAGAGRVRIGGTDVAKLPPWKRGLGMVFQNYALWPHLTVGANVAFGLEERRWPRERIRARVKEMLELVRLEGYEGRRPSQLSGGQQQRVAIARTLAIEPRVLLLDEPLSNLDAKLRASTGVELKRLQRRLGITTVFVTHDQQEAMTIADRLAVLEGGLIRQVGTPRDLYDAPVDRFVAEFVGSINVYSGKIEADGAGIMVEGFGRIPVTAAQIAGKGFGSGTPVAVAFRPHAVRLAGIEGVGGFVFEADIGMTEFLGEFVRHELRVGDRRVVADLPHARSATVQRAGTRARFVVPQDEIFVLSDPSH
jgi:iron(III) transport system ATP-binding protein